jgi:hypothetical protein
MRQFLLFYSVDGAKKNGSHTVPVNKRAHVGYKILKV